MSTSEIRNIGLAGAGTMGIGIAQVIVLSGYSLKWFDASQSQLEKGLERLKNTFQSLIEKEKLSEEESKLALARIQLVNTADALEADVIIEAIVERLDVKQKFFKEVASVNPESTLLCSNTSSLSITSIAAGIPVPERLAGLHFFNPAGVMKLVEVIRGTETSETTIHTLLDWAKLIGKKPVAVSDTPGFIVNRVARPYYTESLKLVEEGVANPEQVDRILESCGFKMGAFRLMDLIGNDINFEVTRSMYHAFHGEPRFRPSRIQEQKVAAGHLGRKTGRGFYRY